jgi:hypothetical protein
VSDISEEIVDRMMVKCGRRCCICRKFKSTLLQVHHIVQWADGGTNDEDNLIVLCLASIFSCSISLVPAAGRAGFNPGFIRAYLSVSLRWNWDAPVRVCRLADAVAASDDEFGMIAAFNRNAR